MAQTPTPSLLTETEFRSSRYGDVADSVNAKLSDLIMQAENYVEDYVDRRLAASTHVETHRGGHKWLFVRQYPINRIEDIRVRRHPREPWTSLSEMVHEYHLNLAGEPTEDPKFTELDNFIIPHPDLPQLEYIGSRDYHGYEMEITYEAGFDPVPPIVKAAVILQTVIFSNVDIEVYGIGDGKEPGILYLQDQVHGYMNPYKRIRRFY